MIGLTLNYLSLFAWRYTDAADVAPDLKVGASVLDLCCFHVSSRFHWGWPAASEIAKQRQRCSLPYVCSYRRYRSAQVSLSKRAVLFLPRLRHCGPAQTR